MEHGCLRELHRNTLQPYIQRFNYVGLVFELTENFEMLHYAPADKMSKSDEGIRKYILDMKRYFISKEDKNMNIFILSRIMAL